MNRTLSILLALLAVGLSMAPAASAELASESAEASVPEPANQTTNVTVTVGDFGATTVSVTSQGNVTNVSQQATVDALGTVGDVVDLIIQICNDVTPQGVRCA